MVRYTGDNFRCPYTCIDEVSISVMFLNFILRSISICMSKTNAISRNHLETGNPKPCLIA